jgi:hypothetical protein
MGRRGSGGVNGGTGEGGFAAAAAGVSGGIDVVAAAAMNNVKSGFVCGTTETVACVGLGGVR